MTERSRRYGALLLALVVLVTASVVAGLLARSTRTGGDTGRYPDAAEIPTDGRRVEALGPAPFGTVGAALQLLVVLACPAICLGMGFLGRSEGRGHRAGQDLEAPEERPDMIVSVARGVARLVLGVALANTFQAAPAEAQHAKAPGHPGFEHVHALAVAADSQTLWLGAHAGLFRSGDGGRSWQPVKLSGKTPHLDIMTLVGDPRDAKTVYVGTHEAGVFRTRDGGGSWAPVNTGIGGLDVHGLALDPNEPAKLHAAVRGQGEGVYRTTDAGNKWVRVDDGPVGEVKVLASVNISTGMGGIFLYAGTAEGLLRSPDCF